MQEKKKEERCGRRERGKECTTENPDHMRHILFLAVLAALGHAGRAADLRGALRGGNLARGGAGKNDEAPMVATAPLMDVDGTDLPEATATGAEGGATGPEMAHIAATACIFKSFDLPKRIMVYLEKISPLIRS